MTIPTTEQLLGGGAQVATFKAPGDAIEGTILHKDVNQETDYKTGEKKFYPRSGDPIWQIIATVQTTLREDSDDDGTRRIYIKSGMFKTLQQVIRDQKLKDIEPGGYIRVVYTGDGIAEGGANAPKLYEVNYWPPQANGQQGPQPQAQPQAQQAPQHQQAVSNVAAGLGGQPLPGGQVHQPGNYHSAPQQSFPPQPQYQPAPSVAPAQQQAAPISPYAQQVPPQPPQPAQQVQPQAPAGGQAPTQAQLAALNNAGITNPEQIRAIYPGYQG